MAVARVGGDDSRRKVGLEIDSQSRVVHRFVVVIKIFRLEISRRERTTIVKETYAAANNRAIIRERTIKHRDARRDVVLMRDRVAVKTYAAIQRQVLVELPTILDKAAQLHQRPIDIGRPNKINLLAERLVRAPNLNRPELKMSGQICII